MACPAFGSTSEVSLFYQIDPDPTLAIPATFVWKPVRMTGESFDLQLSSTMSNEISSTRSYSDSILTQGTVTGGFNFEASAGSLDDWLICALQANKDLSCEATPASPWNTAQTIKNGSTKKCLAFLKKVVVGATTYYYTYRGCQVDQLTLDMKPGAIVTGSVTVQGSGGAVATTPGASWTYSSALTNPLMSSVDNVDNFALTDHADVAIAATVSSLTLVLSNQLRAQNAIGSLYPSGIASGRFQASSQIGLYFQNEKLYTQMLNNNRVKLFFELADSAGEKFGFDMNFGKVQSGVTPQAGGPDQDLLINPQVSWFEDATTGTVSITKTVS